MDASHYRQEIGQRIRLAREAIGLTQTEFAKLHGLDKTKLSHWERGKHYPDPLFIRLLWDQHRVSADWILLGVRDGLPLRVVESLRAAEAASSPG